MIQSNVTWKLIILTAHPAKSLPLAISLHRPCMQRDLSESLTGSLPGAAQDEKRLYVRSQEARAAAAEPEEAPGEGAPGQPPGAQAGSAAARRKRAATSKSLDVETGGVEIFNENENALYCVCQQPYNVDTSMIECDSCHEWYHVKCVGLSQVCILPTTS